MNLPKGIFSKIMLQHIPLVKQLQFFDTRVVEFSARSRDLTIMDYFVYRHKSTVFRSTRHISKNFVRLLEIFVLT
jgi:hypothetical protein